VILKSIIRILLLTTLPAAAAYLGKENSILDVWKQQKYLGDNFNIDLVKQILVLGSVLITGFYLSLANELTKNKCLIIGSQRTSLISTLKQSFLEALGALINDPTISEAINVRIWTRDKSITTFIKNLLLKRKNEPERKCFVIKNIDGLSNISDNTKDLKFEVEPEVQGLVGKCYNVKGIVYDEDTMNPGEDYYLTPFQKNKTRGTRFVLCAPIFNEKDEIESIISFDSLRKITLPVDTDNEEKIVSLITVFCQSLYENAPDLFN